LRRCHTYWWIVLFVIVSGLGTAAYHPEGSKFAAYASGAGVRADLGSSRSVATSAIVGDRDDADRRAPRVAAFVVLPCLAVAAMLLWLVPFYCVRPPKRQGTPGGG
jgi:hypothetical protein